jgi:hypothetical protein
VAGLEADQGRGKKRQWPIFAPVLEAFGELLFNWAANLGECSNIGQKENGG